MFISEHLVSVLSDVCGFMSSPQPPMLHAIATQVEQGFPVDGKLFQKHTFSHLAPFFTQLLTTITTAPILLKVLKVTVCALSPNVSW